MAAPAPVAPSDMDKAYPDVDLKFRFNVKNMSTTGSSSVANLHWHPDHLLELAGISDHDLLNAHTATITTSANGGQYGVSLFHTVKKDKTTKKFTPTWVKVIGSEGLLVDSDDAGGEMAHSAHHITMPGLSSTKSLSLHPSSGMLSGTEGERLVKKLSSKWRDVSHDNVNVAVTKVALDDETRYVVHEKDAKGVPSALHRLLVSAEKNPRFFGGRYAGENGKTTGIDGKMAYEMPASDFYDLKNQLADILETKTDFRDGLGVQITKIADAPLHSPGDNHLVVHVKLQRHPFDPEHGFKQSQPARVVTAAHIDTLEGGGPPSNTSTLLTRGVVGFGDKLRTDPEAASRVKMEAFVPGEDVRDRDSFAEMTTALGIVNDSLGTEGGAPTA